MHDVEATRLLHSMLRIESRRGQEGRAARFLVAELAHHGLRAEVTPRGHALAIAGAGPRTLALVARLDCASPTQSVRLEGSELHGPGAVLGKGPLAAFSAATIRFAKSL